MVIGAAIYPLSNFFTDKSKVSISGILYLALILTAILVILAIYALMLHCSVRLYKNEKINILVYECHRTL